MGLNHISLKAIIDLKGSGKALAAGYPDIFVEPLQIKDMLGAVPGVRPDSREIIAWHGQTGRISALPDTGEVFRLMGYALDVIDIHASRGCERIADLNYPLDWPAQYDLVLDAGTTEHCFNVATALMNLAGVVKLNGHIVHASPMAMFNHGFYNYNPTLLAGFYEENGFELKQLQMIAGQQQKMLMMKPHERFNFAGEGAWILCIAQRKVMQGLRYPMQRKYQQNPDLKAA